MDWNLAIEKNRATLTQIVAGLFVLVEIETCSPSSSPLWRGSIPEASNSTGWLRTGGTPSGMDSCDEHRNDGKGVSATPFTIGPITRRYLVRVLRTVEAALRRLIVLYVHVYGVKASARKKRDRPLPDFSLFGKGAGDKPPVFNLFDPRKRLVLGFDGEEDTPLPSSSPLWRGSIPEAPNSTGWLRTGGAPSGMDSCDKHRNDDAIEILSNPTTLLRRLRALDHALKTLPQQANRLVRIMAQREKAEPGPRKVGPIRPGIPPGYARRSDHPSHHILRECHGLVRDWEACPP
ncbi:MAG: hypothetical protein QNJ29_10900 [Rhizobiaceae bacterium]|nr:hypothetical protein [Rhizobiaceae bacterium]